jgi:hypothetical protein
MRVVFLAGFLMLVILASVASGQECREGDRRLCGSDVGVCEPGRTICVNGTWMECNGTIGPLSTNEICGNGVDDNCDGAIDENCFPWVSFILVGMGIFFIGLGLYYMQKGKGERIRTGGLAKD